MALQVHHSPHPLLYAGPSDRSNMHAQEFVREPAIGLQSMVRGFK